MGSWLALVLLVAGQPVKPGAKATPPPTPAPPPAATPATGTPAPATPTRPEPPAAPANRGVAPVGSKPPQSLNKEDEELLADFEFLQVLDLIRYFELFSDDD